MRKIQKFRGETLNFRTGENMRVLDPGHKYALKHLDGPGEEILTFVKREGASYPGNVGKYAGTNLQEDWRAGINRLQYLNTQQPHAANGRCIERLRANIADLEKRAAEQHGRSMPAFADAVEDMPVCDNCGHVECAANCQTAGWDDPVTQESAASHSLRAWHATFRIPLSTRVAVPPIERRDLRVELIREELRDFTQASAGAGDVVEAADALADLLYVVYGAALEWGIPLDAVFAEVHRSNMTKVWPDGTVHYREDGKVLKPSTYSPADIRGVLERYT